MISAIQADFASLAEKPALVVGPPEETMLPMPDGVRLYTVKRVPSAAGPFPTILMRSCYPKQIPMLHTFAEQFCRHGFAFVYQFCRGSGESEGEWVPNIHERQDGKETLDWLNAQEWVENIGYWGCSYLALTGWAMADIVPEKVKTLYLTHYGTDRFTSAYQGGLFRQDVLTAWAMENAGFPVKADYMESVRYRPQAEVDEKLWGCRLDWYRDWITHTDRDDPYWSEGFWGMLKGIPAKVKIPVYIGEGWYDHHLGSALRTFEALSPESRAHSVLRVGAWNHGFGPCVEGTACDHLENSDALSAFSWFDTILRKKTLPEGKVRIYQIGADRWQEKSAFPFSCKNVRRFYLNAASAQEDARLLADMVPPEQSSVSYRYDPDNPVPSHGSESLLRTFGEIGSLRQPACGWRKDVVSFVSAPVESDLEILGKIEVELYVSSTADDTAFTAKLMEVYPDGSAYNIRSGITTLAYREDADRPRTEYVAGNTVEARIVLWDISWRLHAGSRLRVDISSSDSPQYAVHTNYKGVWALQKKARTAEQTIYTGADTPSQVLLSVQ